MSAAPPQDRAITQVLQHLGAGDWARATDLCRRILAADAGHAEALHLLGIAELQTGQPAEALEHIESSIRLSPENAVAYSNQGNALQALERYGEAADAYRHSLALAPAAAPTHANLGNALMQLERWDEAIAAFQAALELNPNLAEVYRNLAVVWLAQGKPEQAYEAVMRGTQLAPGYIEMRVTLGNVLLNLARTDDAASCYRQVLAARPDSAELHCNLGNALRRSGQLGEAIEHYDKALAIEPDYTEAHYGRAIAHEEAGELDLALARLRQVLTLKPNMAKAWRSIAGISHYRDPNDPDIADMKAAFTANGIKPTERAELGFALGKCHDDLGQHETAFDYYQAANEARRTGIEFSMAAEAGLFGNLKATFTRERLKQVSQPADTASEKVRPIFIVGMPRSGTTLVEQILASHPNVVGGGELDALPTAIARHFQMIDGVDYTRALTEASADTLRRAADEYRRVIAGLSAGASAVTDKLPMNFLNLGMIRLMFPSATIIHCQRHPLDTCLSIYFHNFAAKGHYYAYDLDELGQYYELYEDLMAHWRSLFADAIYEIKYESLVVDQERESRALLQACGLSWDPACLDFHRTRRQVSTISAPQVRRPMYTNAVERWKPYKDRLGPLINRFGSR